MLIEFKKNLWVKFLCNLTIMSDKTYMQEYYAKNRTKLLDYNKEKIACPKCQKYISRNYVLQHQKSHLCGKKRREIVYNFVGRCHLLQDRMTEVIK